MQIQKTKAMAIMITIILTTSLSGYALLLPTASAHSPPWTITTYAYVSAVPTNIGVGQNVFIVMWAYLKMPSSAINNPIRMQNYMLNITKPDGTTTTLGPFTPDPTETTYTTYTPQQTGNYSIVFYYPNTKYVWDNSVASGAATWTNDTLLGATSATEQFTVQQQPVASEPDSYPLPTNYWNYPIEAQNTYWYTISSNWLGTGSPQIGTIQFQQDGSAPNSAHVMWTKPIQAGGIIGGTDVGVTGNQFYTGQSYNQRFPNPIILEGKIYYREPAGESGQAGDTVCVNLRTGQEVWRRSDLPTLSLAMTYDLETPNQEGALDNGILFSSNFGSAFDPLTGNLLFNVTNVPSGTQVLGPDGSILRYVFSNAGTSSKPSWYLAEWNSSNLWNNAGTTPTIPATQQANVPLTPSMPSAVTTNPYTWNGTAFVSTPPSQIPTRIGAVTVGYGVTWNGNAWINYTTSSPLIGSTTSSLTLAGLGVSTNPSYDWNVSVPWYPTSGTILSLNANNGITTPTATSSGPAILMGVNGTTSLFDPGYIIWGGANNGTANPYTVWAVSLNATAGTAGNLLWMQTYTAPSGANDTGVIVWPETVNFQAGVFNMYETQTQNLYGYSIYTGNQLWGPVADPLPFDTFTGSVNTENTGSHHVAYGNLYKSGYGGVLFCYNDTTGQLEWTYGNGGAGNSTAPLLGTPWGYLPTFIAGIADGKVYLFNDEHSPTTPLYKGVEVRAVNATTGQELWTLPSWGDGGGFVAQCGAIADGEWVYLNMYDMQIYAIGQGPSQTTVTAPDTASTLGTPIVIRGTVTDTSAGTQQEQQKADFPNGVPAVSDASQSSWMPYVYQQKPMPTNATGVPVQLYVLDSNGNYRQIGTATTDSSGMFTFTWTPDITGSYKLTASFAGSNSYYPSSAESSFAVTAAAATPTATQTTQVSSNTDTYVIGVGIAIIIAIAIVGVILAMMLRKRP